MDNRGWQRVFGLGIPYFIVVGVFQLIGYIIANIDIFKNEIAKTTSQHLIISIFDLIGTFLIIWIFVKFADKDKFINLGFNIKNRYKDLYFGVFLGFISMFLGYMALIYNNEINYLTVKYNIKEIILSAFLFLIVAVVEETLFRGYILKNLMISFNKYIALMISSLLFAIAHGANPNMSLFSFFDLFLAGIFLGISYIYTKNLWFPIALHFSWNLFQTFFGFNVSGQDMYSIIEFEIQENNLLNGGDFGFEGSILSTIFQIIFIFIIWFYYNKKEKTETTT